MRRLLFSILAVVSFCAASAPAACIAQADIQGTYLLAREKSDNVAQIVESTVSQMNFFVRSLARQKISKAAKAHEKLSILLTDNAIRIHADNNDLPTAPTDGTKLTYRNHEGDLLGLQVRMHGNTLEQTFMTNKGSRTNICELSRDGGILEMHVVIKSNYLDGPIKYKLVYQRCS
jgi:hypothetical protein